MTQADPLFLPTLWQSRYSSNFVLLMGHKRRLQMLLIRRACRQAAITPNFAVYRLRVMKCIPAA
jgi:hypothetical protein